MFEIMMKDNATARFFLCSGSEVIILVSCLAQLSMKLKLLINNELELKENSC